MFIYKHIFLAAGAQWIHFNFCCFILRFLVDPLFIICGGLTPHHGMSVNGSSDTQVLFPPHLQVFVVEITRHFVVENKITSIVVGNQLTIYICWFNIYSVVTGWSFALSATISLVIFEFQSFVASGAGNLVFIVYMWRSDFIYVYGVFTLHVLYISNCTFLLAVC